MIELYAIADHPGPPLPDSAPLRAVPADGLAIICAPAAASELSPDALWRHMEVVDALMRDRDLLPFRYGTRLDDEAAAVRAIAERHAELTTALDRVRGAVELSLRVLTLAGVEDRPAGGADYIRTKARSTAAVDGLHESLSGLARASMRRPARADSELLRAAYLVDRGAVERFVADVARQEEASPDLRLLCTGPWPPYSFASR